MVDKNRIDADQYLVDNFRFCPISGSRNKEQEAIVSAFRHAWKAYRQHAWGKDELRPISKTYSTWFDVGLTMIDSLDTMYIMGLKEGESVIIWVGRWADNNISFAYVF